MIDKIYKVWEDRQIAGALLIDVKGVSRAKLV